MSRDSSVMTRDTPTLLALTLWAYRRLLLVQPPGFRREYGDSIAQVFRQTCLDAYRSQGPLGLVRLLPPAFADVIFGAAAEYSTLLAHVLKGSSHMLQSRQYRRSASIIFAAFIAFVIAGIGFQKTNEDIMKTSLPTTYPILAIAYYAMMAGAVVALLAVLIGGIPVALAALRYGVANRRNDILARFAMPPIVLLVLIAAGVIVFTNNIGGNTPATIHSPQRIAAIGALVVLLIVGAIVSTYAVLSAIARSQISGRLLRFTLLPGVLATIAMVVMVAAHVLWSFGLWQDAPTLFFGNEGILATSTLVGTVVQVVIMVVAALLALGALIRGFSARNGTPGLGSLA